MTVSLAVLKKKLFPELLDLLSTFLLWYKTHGCFFKGVIQNASFKKFFENIFQVPLKNVPVILGKPSGRGD